MNIVTIEACDSASIHYALHEIIPLHPVLTCGAVCKMRECGFAQSVFFERPKVFQLESHAVTHGPVEIFAINWICRWPSLRMALNAGVIRGHIIHCRWIQNVVA